MPFPVHQHMLRHGCGASGKSTRRSCQPLTRVGESRHEIGSTAHHVSVEAISAAAVRAGARWPLRIRTVRINGPLAQTADALAEACGQDASHPRIGGKAVRSLVLSERALRGYRPRPGAEARHPVAVSRTGQRRASKLSTIPLRGQERLSEGGRLGSFGEVLHRRGHTSWSGLAAALNRTGIFGGPNF